MMCFILNDDDNPPTKMAHLLIFGVDLLGTNDHNDNVNDTNQNQQQPDSPETTPPAPSSPP